MTDLILLRDWQASQFEFWRPVEGFPGYEVSSFGRFRTFWERRTGLGTGKGFQFAIGDTPAPLRQFPMRQGYVRVYLYNRGAANLNGRKGNRKCFFAHRLVAAAFVPNARSLPEVNHKTALKSDNRTDNLEWSTRSANQRHAIANGLSMKLDAHRVRQIRKRCSGGESQASLAREFCVTQSAISKIMTGRRWAFVA